MLNDKITLNDLSVFTHEQEGSVFALLDHTSTQAGREVLKKLVINPPANYKKLTDLQNAIKFWAANPDTWPGIISNGTLVMLEKFFESADNATAPPSGINTIFNSFFQKLLNKEEYFFIRFSLSHLSDFLKGCKELVEQLESRELPALLKQEIEDVKEELAHRLTNDIISISNSTSFKDLAQLSFKARREMKRTIHSLMEHFSKLDAWRSLALATIKNNWVFPKLLPPDKINFEASELYHPLLKLPIPYKINFTEGKNFMLLTGANMSGKTTFMRALGVAALLAHIGAGVPAGAMSISYLEGIISNMQIEDDILRGESYFFAEVQRMKHTALKLQQQGSFLVLMDELFKGTNVHDAYECTRAVVEGLLHRHNHVMILSTHLHEVAVHFRDRTDIIFNYFVTQMEEDGSYHFTYELKEGASDDRIGYRILQKEGVLDLLKPKP